MRTIISRFAADFSLDQTFSKVSNLIDQIHLVGKGILERADDWHALEKIARCIVFLRDIITRFAEDFSRTRIFLKASRLIGNWATFRRTSQPYRPVRAPDKDSLNLQTRRNFLDPERETALRWRGIGLVVALGTTILITSMWLADTAPSQGTAQYAPQPVTLPAKR